MEDIVGVSLHTLKYTSVMKMKFKVYTYITPDHEPGTLIVHPDLTAPFDEQKLFEMDNLVVTELSLLDILEKGFIKLGSTDTMEDMDIEYPLIPNDTYTQNRITGKHWDFTQKEVADMIGKEFEVEISEPLDLDSNSLDTVSDASDVENAYEDELEDESLRSIPPEPVEAGSVLQDGKMDELMGHIDNCQQTSVKEVDRLLSELEF